MVEEKRSVMKYIRTYETEEKFLTDKDSTSRGFKLKPTLYKYSEAGDHVQLELDDPRKHGDSTYMEITLDSDVEFSFYIGNAPNDTQTTMNCTIDWGDGTVETKVITKDDKGFKLSHNYKAGSYSIELYDVERDYSVVGVYNTSLISPIDSVKRVVLDNSVVSIGRYAFSGCTSLTSIHIPESVTSIGGYAFSECSSLTSVYIPKSVTSSIGHEVFKGCTSLTSIDIPNGVTSIEGLAFYNCTSLTSIDIPKSVKSIESQAFNGCTSLTSVHISEGVTNIKGWVFINCSSLTSVDIPNSVTSIGESTFNGCSSLTSINIPDRVNSIGNWAFDSCTSLTSISSFNTTAPTLDRNPFSDMSTNGTLHIKPGATGYDAWLSKLPSGWTIVEDL